MSRPETAAVICTVDVVLLTLKDDKLMVALLRRDREPFPGVLALPGGFIHPQEDGSAQDAAARVLLQKTGIRSPYLEQLSTRGGPLRDPRGWSVSIGYYALVAAQVIEASGHPDVRLTDVDQKGELPFDHARIIDTAVARIRSKSQYSSLPCYLAGRMFTLPDLQRVYESLLGAPLNKGHFRRKIEEMGILEPVDGKLTRGAANRPAQLYRLKRAVGDNLVLLPRGL